jgi:hypothetical protein
MIYSAVTSHSIGESRGPRREDRGLSEPLVHLYHLMLAVVDGDAHRRIDSRFYASLDDARRVLGRWRDQYAIPAQHVHDNSDIDLDILFAQMDVDLEGAAESQEAGLSS